MSGDENEQLGNAVSSTGRDTARRSLLLTLTFPLALILISLGNLTNVLAPRGPFNGSLKFIFVVILLSCAVALIIASQKLQPSWPKERSERRLTPRNLRRIARLADVPEPGAMIIVYGGLVAAVIVTTVAFIVSLVSFLS